MPAAADLAVTAPFDGVVISVAHRPEQQVRAGVALIVLEAMKMEIALTAPADGTIEAVRVAVGEMVEEGRELILLAPANT